MFLNCIIETLNTNYLSKSSPAFAGAKFYGLASQVERDKQTWPVLDSDKEIYIGLDDSFPLILYHRLANIKYTNDKYPNRVIATLDFVIVAYGSKKLNLTASELERYIISQMPESLTPTEVLEWDGVYRVGFTLGSSNLNRRQVFDQEYSNVEYRLGEDDVLISHSYTMSLIIDKDCLNTDPCDDVVITSTCEDATAENSDATFSQTIASGATGIMPDNIFRININGNLVTSVTSPSLVNDTINISA